MHVERDYNYAANSPTLFRDPTGEYIAIFSGFGAQRDSGMGKLGTKVKKLFPLEIVRVYAHDEWEQAVHDIERSLYGTVRSSELSDPELWRVRNQADPSQRVILIGHSYGGDAAMEVAKLAHSRFGSMEAGQPTGFLVDLLIQIDSVGSGDEVLPQNVIFGMNYYTRSRKGVNGATRVEGSVNIGWPDYTNDEDEIQRITHTTIDDSEEDGGALHLQILGRVLRVLESTEYTFSVPPLNRLGSRRVGAASGLRPLAEKSLMPGLTSEEATELEQGLRARVSRQSSTP